jgi:hypothetical protein
MPTGKTDPLLTVRIREHNGNNVRMIKVRDHGPIGRRWIHYARWWWEQNKGPVPAGKRVMHLDGDSLNDDPANYALGTPADAAAIWHDLNPKGSARNFAKMRAACAQMNRERGAINRRYNWLPTRWYAIDLDKELVYNRPRRQRWELYRDNGLPVDSHNWRWDRSISLGWPNLQLMQCCILHVLAEKGPLRSLYIRREVTALRQHMRWGPANLTRKQFYYCSSRLGELITRHNTGRPHKEYSITQTALDARWPICTLVMIRGKELGWPPFDRFTKLDEDLPRVTIEQLAAVA